MNPIFRLLGFFSVTDSRAQAALVDSLFFIAIIAALGTGLFYFAINYGLSSESLLNSFYSSDFATDALKVLTYVNISRDGTSISSSRVIQPSDEFDYLFAMVKENYAHNNQLPVKIDSNTRHAIANTLYSVLRPFDDSYDYSFYIEKEGYVVGQQNYLTLILALHRPITNGEITVGATREFYSCFPAIPTVLEKFVFPNVGTVDSALGRISLCETAGQCSSYIIGLNLWISKSVPEINAIMTTIDADPKDKEPNFKCTQIEGIVPPEE